MTTIRKAALEDVPALAPLFDAYRVFYDKASDVHAAETFLKDRLEHNEAHVFVAEVDGNMVGFTLLYPLFSYVQPEFRGQGHSIALIDAAKSLAVDTGAAGLMLETAKSNLIGNQLYPKTGFVCDDEHHYYSWNTQ